MSYYLASQVALNEQQRQSFLNKATNLNSDYLISTEDKKEINEYHPKEPKPLSLGQEKRIETISHIKINWLTIITFSILGLFSGTVDVQGFSEDYAILVSDILLITLFFFLF